MTDRGGGSKKGLVGNARQLGNDLLGLGRVRIHVLADLQGDTSALAPELLLEDSVAGNNLAIVARFIVDYELEAGCRALVVGCTPGPESIQLGSGGRRLAEESQFQSALDRRLAGFVGAANDRETGSQLDIEIAMPAELVQLQARDPHRSPLQLTASPAGPRGGGGQAEAPLADRPALRTGPDWRRRWAT